MNLAHVVAVRNIKNAMEKISNTAFRLIVLAIFTSVATLSLAQGEVKVKADPRLESELQKELDRNDSTDIKGYRIQIYFGNNRNDAEKLERKFKNLYPAYKKESYLQYYQPYWRVRVGNFYRIIDAQKLLHELTDDFENVLLVKDNIELPEIDLEQDSEDEGQD